MNFFEIKYHKKRVKVKLKMDVKQFLQILSLDSPAKICSSITEMELPDEISSENCV